MPGGGTCTAARCVPESQLLYVNNASTNPVCSDSGACSFAAPCCTVQKGLNKSAASAKPVIVFAGNTYGETLTASPAQNGGGNYVATAIGVNGPVLKASSAAIANVTGLSGKQVTLALDGFTFDGSTANGAFTIAGDTMAADYAKTVVTLTRSTVENTPSASIPGISTSADCTLTMDQDVVSNNKGGGISLAATDFNITNILVSGNGTSGAIGIGSAFGGINVSSAGEVGGPMNLINLTVVNNQKNTNTASSGIICSAVPTILNTVVFGNTGGTVQLQPLDCTSTTYSAFPGGTAGTGTGNRELTGCSATQLFTGTAPTPFMPVQNMTNNACDLVDVAAPLPNVSAPDHDLLGTKRPQPYPSGTDDIGCYEKPQP
jgi:hypothetical protein